MLGVRRDERQAPAAAAPAASPEKRRVEFDAEQSPAQRGRPVAGCGRDGRSREVRELELERALEREREERECEERERERVRRTARPGRERARAEEARRGAQTYSRGYDRVASRYK